MATIVQMIAQHHGTRVMPYFYQKAKKLSVANVQEVREKDFRYRGLKPQSKEAAILMMADPVEAASRTLSNSPTPQIQGMIDRLIEEVLADKQFDDCDITMPEIRLVEKSFLKVLSGVHHRRIDYPRYDFTPLENKA